MNSDKTEIVVEPRYEEQFTVFVDFLGFADASAKLDEERQVKVLELLQALAALRSEFVAGTIGETVYWIRPAISTFSDHILISYPLQSVLDRVAGERIAALTILRQFHDLLSRVAAAALQIGFLIRGGATIGKLYHAKGVVFGEALIEAVQLETRTAIYPRVVLSNKITQRQDWITQELFVRKDDDGIYHIDYISSILLRSAAPGNDWNTGVKSWFGGVVPIIERNLRDLEAKGKLNELAKWTWFAKRFRAGLEKLPPGMPSELGISKAAISWS
jgi:hypothetical protein